MSNASERERLARILYGIAGGSDRSDTWGTDNAAPDDVRHAYFDADTLILAGFGDVEQMRAERDAALAKIAAIERVQSWPELEGILGTPAAILNAGSDVMAEAKAAAWDEGWSACEDQVGNFETIRNPYRAKTAGDATPGAGTLLAKERGTKDGYPRMKEAWHNEYGGSPKHDSPSEEFESGWNAHKATS